ncbi:MAG: tetratricopeptide repeat protein [Phycisphaerae bacterium]|nr:tetratricopeptide repeat protein [Saprospiraceae bacterium]
MPDIKNQFNQSTFNDAKFFGDGKPIPRFLTPAAAAVPSSFLGREKELNDIRTLLTRQNTLALVNAEGGMGKTTLAARYWQQYENAYQHLAWLFCENGILAALRAQLPHALGLVETLNQYADKPDQQTQVIKTEMANLPKDCLLVLDNANEEDHIRAFQQVMSGLGWHVLITSRCSKVLSDAESEYKITGLPPAQAKELFKKYHDEKNLDFETLLDRFLEAIGYNTLCIEVFSKNLHEGAGLGMSLTSLLEKLEKNGLFLVEESFMIQTDWANNIQKETLKSTDQLIEALYNVADLQQRHPDLHDLLSATALLPAENHPLWVLGELLRPDDKPGLKGQLDQLAKKGWLATDSATYRISPVLQKILLQRNAERRWALGEPIVQQLQNNFETEGSHSKNIASAGPFAELVFGLADNLNDANKELSIVFDRLWVYHTATGNLAKAMNTAHKNREINERSGDKNGLAISYQYLGDTHSALGNLPQALTFFEKFNALSKELHEAYPENVEFKNGLAISYQFLGNTQTELGYLPQALTFFEQYNQLEKELHETYPQNADFKKSLAISYSKLGGTHTELGNLHQALICNENANQMIKELHEAYPENVEFKNGLSISYSKLGETHRALSNLPQALTLFKQLNQLAKELHEAYPENVEFKNGLSISYSKLGSTHSALGNLTQALTFFEQYNGLAKELHEANPENVEFKNGLAVSYSQLGRFFLDKKGDSQKGKDYFQQCFALWKDLSEEYPDYVQFRKYFEWANNALGD